MALPTYQVSDFKGVIALNPNRFGEVEYDTYIERYKKQYLLELLGAKAYADMRDTDKVKWNTLLSGGSYSYIDCNGDEQMGYFTGLDSVLLFIIYFYIVRDDFTMTETGAVYNYNENTWKVKQYPIAKDRWNSAVKYWEEIADFFKRIETIVYTADSYSDLGGQYEITVLATTPTFLDISEVITLQGVDYQIVAKTIDEGVSETITINAPSGLIIESFTQKPYASVKTAVSPKRILI